MGLSVETSTGRWGLGLVLKTGIILIILF